jgi:hypothetical protein
VRTSRAWSLRRLPFGRFGGLGRLRRLRRFGWLGRRIAPAALALLALAVYLVSNPLRSDLYNHFVWQADAYLHGRVAIPWPVVSGPFRNIHFLDIMPLSRQPGFGLMPYPPLPAILLLPLVAISGLAAKASLVAAALGALNVGLAMRLAGRLTSDIRVALLATIFYGFGTVAWYAAAIGSTWFLAHVVASTFLFLGITVAIDAELRGHTGGARGVLRQAFASLVFGVGALSRLTTILGAPFFVFVGAGGNTLRRALAGGVGAAIPVALLLAYNLATTGAILHPAYEYAYRNERPPRRDLIHRDWAIEDIRYIPQNAVIMLGWLPVLRPECAPAPLDRRCPLLSPDPLGMSLLLTSPGYLLLTGLALRPRRAREAEIAATADIPTRAEATPGPIRDPAATTAPRASRASGAGVGDDLERRLIIGSALAVLAIALVNLAHFSQGWVQFGYRFSNDFSPFLVVLVVLALARIGVRPISLGLVALSVLVNAWGVYWGVAFRW